MPKQGTAEWFERVRHRCIDHLRALLSIQLAHHSIQEILHHGESLPPIVKAALHSNCVVAYSRPFTSAMSASNYKGSYCPFCCWSRNFKSRSCNL